MALPSRVKRVYFSGACNKTPHAIDWGNNGIISYSSCNSVQLCTYGENIGMRNVYTLIKHTKPVTSVHWIQTQSAGKENELISTSADKTAIIWTLPNLSEFSQIQNQILRGHTDIVKTACALCLTHENNDELLVATSSVDSTIRIWRRRCSSIHCNQVISLGRGFAFTLKIVYLQDGKDVALLFGAEDTKIHLYTLKEDGLFYFTIYLRGHEDWIQGLDVMRLGNGDILLASASQDCFVRMWKISSSSTSEVNEELKFNKILFSTEGSSYCASLESVLSGHENWVYSVQWQKMRKKSNSEIADVQLLSASMDKTVIIWQCDPVSNIWLEKVRVGDVGGNTMGFYGCLYSPSSDIIMAHGAQGAIHVWIHNEECDTWQPGIGFGGHFSSVQDVDWNPDGEFILTCSSDQTTRLHAPFINDETQVNWCEISRPQIHGYDVISLAVLDNFHFVSASSEKVIRVFQAPRTFAKKLEHILDLDPSDYLKGSIPEKATLPSLGLVNTPLFKDDENKELHETYAKKDAENLSNSGIIKVPPSEEILLQDTLWPEFQKLYGHPNEIFTIAANHSKTLLASACKATKGEHAAIILWDILTWKQCGKLYSHNLTITQMAFSPNDMYLLSVSRDRTWCIYQYFPGESPLYRKVDQMNETTKIHTRIIWSCAWSFDSKYFATASRDKKVAIWSRAEVNGDSFSITTQPLTVEESATAVSFAPCHYMHSNYIIAIGLENGNILIEIWNSVSGWKIYQKLDKNIAHHLGVNRLKFSPVTGEAGNKRKDANVIQLASCSSDCHMNVYSIFIGTVVNQK